jgi:hypothetical protein
VGGGEAHGSGQPKVTQPSPRGVVALCGVCLLLLGCAREDWLGWSVCVCNKSYQQGEAEDDCAHFDERVLLDEVRAEGGGRGHRCERGE